MFRAPERPGRFTLRLLAMFAIALLLLSLPAIYAQSNSVTIDYGRSWPRSIVVDTANGLAYVDGMSGIYPPTGYSFGIVNMSSHTLEKVLPLNVTAGEMALDPARGNLYIAGSDSIEVFDTGSQAFVGQIKIGLPIRYIIYDEGTGNVFLTSGNAVYQLNPANGVTQRNASVGMAAEGIAVDPSDGELFVASYLSCSIAVLKASTLELTTTIHLPAPCYPSQVALDPQRHKLYVASGTNAVDVVDTRLNSFEDSIAVSPGSSNATIAITLDARTGNVFVLTAPGTSVTQVDASTGRVVERFQLTSGAYEMATNEATGELYVTVYHDIQVFSPSFNQPETILPLLVWAAVLLAILVAATFMLLRPRSRNPKLESQNLQFAAVIPGFIAVTGDYIFAAGFPFKKRFVTIFTPAFLRVLCA